MTDFFNKVKQHFQNNLPFVIYKKPNTELINGLLQNDDKLNISQNLSESGFIFSSFDTNKKILQKTGEIGSIDSFINTTKAKISEVKDLENKRKISKGAP